MYRRLGNITPNIVISEKGLFSHYDTLRQADNVSVTVTVEEPRTETVKSYDCVTEVIEVETPEAFVEFHLICLNGDTVITEYPLKNVDKFRSLRKPRNYRNLNHSEVIAA